MLNGAIILKYNGKVEIEAAKDEKEYEKSGKEKAVLITGPLLLHNQKKVKLENVDFVNKRHPRTCICLTKDAILLITIDGRSNKASGINLNELQNFLKYLGAIDAINLDGGGSTTLWFNDGIESKILNQPSDKTGERPVANAIIIR